MSVRYVLAPEAARDLVEIWRYIKSQSSVEVAGRAESVIRERIGFLAKTPGAGHWNRQRTNR
jgi:plasmid stabilization system protein ParE